MASYDWQYCSLGGAIRVKIASGEDIAHLGELDQKLWTVLSCPVDGLEFDRQTLDLIDTEHDGKIMVNEVVQASQWLTSVIKDKDLILKGDSALSLDQINTDNETGKKLYDSARQILRNLGLDKQEISVEDALDTKAIFTGTKFNGDGIITSVTADNEAQARTIADCIATIGSESDRSGESGITAELIEKFYSACTAYAQWKDQANAEILPFGDNTAAAYEACNAVKDKISDFFTRCRLLSFDKTVAESVNVAVTDIDSIASCPIAKPAENGILPFGGINPAWKPAFDKFLSLTLDFTPENKEGINEKEWNAILGKFNAYAFWIGSKAGCEVESLGIERVEEILKENRKDELLALVKKDKALKAESDSIDDVKKLMLYYRDLYRLLKNFVLFSDFYSRAPGVRAMFELGQLYIDQRCCDLCIRVADMSKHADMAKLSGIFLIYFKCSSKKLGKSMDAVAVMTDGDINDLRPGKNGIFYDLQGNDYDAVITKVVDNPVSIKQAFWAPYRKAWEFCGRIINKSAADKDDKINSELQGQLQNVAATAPAAAGAAAGAAAPIDKKQIFDIAKFAGIFAALGMALGYISKAITDIAKGIASTPVDKILLMTLGLLLVISGPSCFIAWTKLRKRNLGPVLNANGWAINSKVLVNVVFGGKVTSIAKYPKLRLADPYKQKTAAWKIWLPIVIILLLIAAFAVLYFCGCLDFIFCGCLDFIPAFRQPAQP